MRSAAFWSEWHQPLKGLFAGAGIVVLLLMLFCLVADLAGYSLVLEWYLSSETESFRLAVQHVDVGLFEIEMPADVLLMKQHFEGSPWIIRPWTGTLYLVLIFAFYSILLAVATYLSRFWYLVSCGAFIGILISLRLEQLLLFGWFDYKPLALALLLFLPLSYYFHAFDKKVSFAGRLLCFAAAFAALSLLVGLGAQVANPFYTLAQYNFSAPVLLTVAFCLLVGHEVIYFILKMITRAKAPTAQKNWVHFFVFSVIYLANVALVYARNAEFIKWDLIYLGEVLILVVAGVLGLWGLQAREERYGSLAPFYPFAALFYVALAGISFTTIGYQLAQGNDPVLETFEDAIVFSQLGFGGMFLFYIIVNFITPLMRNMAVYRIVFKEGTLPYTTYRIAGVIAVVAFYLLSNQVAFSQALAGFYNGLGDLYKTRNQQLLSQQYYRQGAAYGYQNHKSNYQLGFIANQKEKPGEAVYHFEQASGKHPSAYSFVNLANQYQYTGQFFKAVFALQEAANEFPDNGYINNNLGVQYLSTNLLDSALQYLRNGSGSDFSARASRANIAYLAFKAGTAVAEEEIEEAITQTGPYPFLANAMASQIKAGQADSPESVMALVPDSVLTGFSYPFVNNAALASLEEPGTILAQRLPALADASANAGYFGSLSVALALQLYYQGNAAAALQRLDQVQQAFPSLRAYCMHLMGAISLEQGAAMEAAEFFEQADAEDYRGAGLNQAIALSEAGELEQARLKWALLEKNEEFAAVAGEILRLFEAEGLQELHTDQDRYQYIRWFGTTMGDEQLEDAWTVFDDSNMRNAAMTALAANYLKLGQTSKAAVLMAHPLLNGYGDPSAELVRLNLALADEGLAGLERFVSFSSLPLRVRRSFQESLEAFRNNEPDALAEAAALNPFLQYLAVASAAHLRRHDREEAAHSVLVAAQQVNPAAAHVLKFYIGLSLEMGLEDYAEGALVRLQFLLPSAEYTELERSFEEKLDSLRQSRENWNF